MIHPEFVVERELDFQWVGVQLFQCLCNRSVTLSQYTEEKRLGSNGVVGESSRFLSTER